MAFRGAATFVSSTQAALLDALNRYARDVQDGFRTLERAVAALQTISVQQFRSLVASGPADPISFTSGAVTPAKSGTYLALASFDGTISGADGLAIDLRVDGEILQIIYLPSTSTGWAGMVVAVAALDPTVSHTWTLTATTFGGVVNLSSAAGQARIVLVEF